MRNLRDEGVSYRTIAAWLNAEGVPGKRGGRWHATPVARVLDGDARQQQDARSAHVRERQRHARRAERIAKQGGLAAVS
jgi:hypothetical protein